MPTDPDFKITDAAAEASTRLKQRYDTLKRSRTTALLVAVIQRFGPSAQPLPAAVCHSLRQLRR